MKKEKKQKENKKKITKELLKTHRHQEIIITGSKLFAFLELFSVWLHIAALIIGILTIAGVVSDASSEAAHYLEIATIVVVALIIIQHALMPFAERIVLRALLDEFWGTNDIPTRFSIPTEIDINEHFGKVKKTNDIWQIEKTELKWVVARWVPFKKVLTVRQESPVTTKRFAKYAAEDGTLNTAFIPLYIIIDIKENIIKFQGRAHLMYTKDKNYPEKRITFNFHYVDRRAEWSGQFPEHPLFGEWLWDSDVAKNINKQNEGKRNTDKKNSKGVAKAFKESGDKGK